MPTRILREGIVSSEKVNSLSLGAEVFYRRLMSVVDDYGRFFAHESILRTACYPLQLDRVSDTDVKAFLGECLTAKLVTIYNSGKYLFIVEFRQQTRSKSKFPDPVADKPLINCKAETKQMSRVVGVGVGVEDVVGVVTETNEIPDPIPIIKSNLLPLYSRKVTDRLSSMEESYIFEVSRRPGIREELAEVLAFRQRDSKYFPRSLSALVSDWQKTLDHARVCQASAGPAAEHPNTVAIRERMRKEAK